MDRFQATGPDEAVVTDSADSVRFPVFLAAGSALAVCIASPVLMGVTGDDTWYALPLMAALFAVWWRARLGRRQVGLSRGHGYFGHATLLPLVVVGCAVWLATLVGATRVSDTPIRLLGLQVSLMAALTAIGTVLTEDGFFRGALWGVLDRAGRSTYEILLWTSTANAVWYAPILLFMPARVEGAEALIVHGLNIWLLALCWGVLRLASGSVLIAAWSHGLWNGLAYTLFGFGAAGGAIGVIDPLRFDPERGWAGVALNACAALVLLRWWRRREAHAAVLAAEQAAAEAKLDERSQRRSASTEPREPGR